MNTIEKILYEIHKNLNLNQAQLADLMGVKASAVGKWKTRDKIPKNSKRFLIVDLGISETFLETGEGPFYTNEEEGRNEPKKAILKDEKNKNVKNTISESDSSRNLKEIGESVEEYEARLRSIIDSQYVLIKNLLKQIE